MRRLIYTALLLLATASLATAQEARDKNILAALRHGWNFELRAGLSMGGTAPIPMPREIRGVEKYNPKLNVHVEGQATKWFDPHWGLVMGLRMEQKGMVTGARVKNYHTSLLLGEGAEVSGNWTGYVESNYAAASIVLPISAAYKINDYGKVQAGLYAGYRFDGSFTGHVTDGHFRMGSPVGERVDFPADKQATYDFSGELSRFEAGMQVGGNWRAYRHFLVYGELRASFTPIFPGSFTALTTKLYPIYVSTGFSYLF